MRRLTVCAVALFALATAGCGAQSDQADQADQAAAASPGPSGSNSELADNLLTLNDMPTYWVQAQIKPDNIDAPELLAGCKELPVKGSAPSAEIQFAGGAQGPVVSEILSKPSQSAAERQLAAAKQAAQSCKRFTTLGASYELADLQLPKLGDDSVAFRLTGTGKTPLHGDIVVARVGDMVALITHIGTDPDRALTTSAAQTAVKDLTD